MRLQSRSGHYLIEAYACAKSHNGWLDLHDTKTIGVCSLREDGKEMAK